MKIAHTPGPWKLKRSGTITDADGELIATTGYRCRVGSDEDECNARLIVAAPELLEALQIIVNSEEYQGETVVCDFATLQSVARHALAKAEAGA